MRVRVFQHQTKKASMQLRSNRLNNRPAIDTMKRLDLLSIQRAGVLQMQRNRARKISLNTAGDAEAFRKPSRVANLQR